MPVTRSIQPVFRPKITFALRPNCPISVLTYVLIAINISLLWSCSNDTDNSENDTSSGVDTDTTLGLTLDSDGPDAQTVCAIMNCDDGNDCTTDTCDQARCVFTPTTSCSVGAPDTCVHWDDVCGEGCDWTQDYDCAQWAWQVPLVMRAPEEHAQIIYVDPQYDGSAGESDGTIERPFIEWDAIDFQELLPDTAVLQKRGTEATVGWDGARPRIAFSANDVLIGAYGDQSLPRPKLLITSALHGTGDRIVFRDLELERVFEEDGGAARGLSITGFQGVIYNVWIHGTSEENAFKYECINAGGSRALKVLHSEISHCGSEVVMGGGHLIEVGYTKMEKVAYPDGGNGDGFQFGDDVCKGIWFHDNDFDGRYINAKFFVITTCGTSTIVIENNHIKMAQNRSATHVGGERVIMRRNLFEYIEKEAGATGLWLTGGNYEIYHNIFINYAKAMNSAGTRKVFNNSFIGYTDVAMDQGRNSDVRNNIFAEPGSAWGLAGMTSNNNLFAFDSTVSPGPMNNNSTEDTSLVADPQLSDNYSPLLGSPAVDSGDGNALDELTPLSIDGGVWRDFAGYPIDPTTLDIGAREFLH